MSFGAFGTGGSTTSSRKGSDGFFGNILAGLSEGLGKVASEGLPLWAAKELKLQQSDQLDDSTFDPSQAKPRLDDGLTTTGDSAIASVQKFIGVDRNAVMIIGGGFLLAGLVFFISRR